MSKKSQKRLTTVAGAPVPDNQNAMTAGPRGPMLLQDVWFLEKLAHFDREVIPERRMHAKGSGAFGTFTVTHDITKYTKAKIFSQIGKKTDVFVRFSTVLLFPPKSFRGWFCTLTTTWSPPRPRASFKASSASSPNWSAGMS